MTIAAYPPRYDYTFRGSPASFMARMTRIPNLSRDEEVFCVQQWQQHKKDRALDALLAAHQKMIVKHIYSRRAQNRFEDALQAGNEGIIKALANFDLERGFRLATYVGWWIDVEIDGVMKNGMVNLGTSADRKKVISNISKALAKFTHGAREPTQADFQDIADLMNVDLKTVMEIYPVVTQGDYALDAPMLADEEGRSARVDYLIDSAPSAEEVLINLDEIDRAKRRLRAALDVLNERERVIFHGRRMADPVKTLEELADIFNVSRERVRQIEIRAFDKVCAAMNAPSSPAAVSEDRFERFKRSLLKPVSLDV